MSAMCTGELSFLGVKPEASSHPWPMRLSSLTKPVMTVMHFLCQPVWKLDKKVPESVMWMVTGSDISLSPPPLC